MTSCMSNRKCPGSHGTVCPLVREPGSVEPSVALQIYADGQDIAAQTCFCFEHLASAHQLPSWTSFPGTWRLLWGICRVLDHMPPSCSCCRTSVESTRSQSGSGIAGCRDWSAARSLGWRNEGEGMGPYSQPAFWDRRSTVEKNDFIFSPLFNFTCIDQGVLAAYFSLLPSFCLRITNRCDLHGLPLTRLHYKVLFF